MRLGRPLFAGLLAAATLCGASPAHANLELGALARALGTPAAALPGALSEPRGVVVELPEGAVPPPGFVAIAGRLGVVDASAGELARLAGERPELGLEWTPPLRLLLDRADGFTRASGFRGRTGHSGSGVIIGVIDTGVDPRHPDLRDATGRSRIRWWLDFSRAKVGFHPELEDEFGCGGDAEGRGGCAVLSGDDVELLLANGDPADDPDDPFGHGTHVASIAAGRGAHDSPYVGVAPEASLIVVRASRASGQIFDTDVLKAARFVFDRAAELGMPAVLNLSLGSDFGGHDGSSGLERGLERLVGRGVKGRAIVVAAGNSASLYDGIGGAPGPFGVHTEVHVPRGARAAVPLAMLPANGTRVHGAAYFWIGSRPGDALSVGVSDTSGAIVSPISRGRVAFAERGGARVTVANQIRTGDFAVPAGTDGAVVIIEGNWLSSRTFGIVLEGHGSARIWAHGTGGLSPESGPGPLLPRARKEGTVNVPASSPGLIAVGATLNRSDWIDESGQVISFPEHGALDDAPPGSTAYFSSAGPNALGGLKPELVAPGANVIGAMASAADPARSASSGMFASDGRCEIAGYSPFCYVVDPRHAVAAGTSMAAPLVAGAVALLFERDPELDQPTVKALLKAGARAPEGVVFDERQLGAGVLDLELTLDALDAKSTAEPSTEHSRLVLSASFAHPDPRWPLEGTVVLRDGSGQPAGGFDRRRLSLDAFGASVSRPLAESARGLWEFAIAAPAGSGGRRLSLAVRFDGRLLLERELPIAVDPALAEELPRARGGCGLARSRGGAQASLLLFVVALGSLRRRRARQSVSSSTK